MKDNKKKKKTAKNTQENVSHLQNQLRRQKEKLAREEQKREKSRNALFRRRVREASAKKAPKTLRTKSYYRFSKDFPATVTPDGFRENNPEKEKLSSGKKIFVAIICIAVFLFALLMTETAILLSEKPLSDEATQVNTDAFSYESAVHFTSDELEGLSSDMLLAGLKERNADTAVFDFKDEYGYVYFRTEGFTGASADRIIPDAGEKLQLLKKNGIKLVAYISCFKDTVAASSLQGAGLKTASGTDYIDAEGNAWLDPFSETATAYINGVISSALSDGFDAVLLDNICFPDTDTAQAPVFSGDASSSEKKSSALISFIDNAVKLSDSKEIIVMSLISGISKVTDAPSEKYGGLLTDSDCSGFAADLRIQAQSREITEGSSLFSFIDEMPGVFILDAASLAVNSLEEDSGKKLYAIIDKTLPDGNIYAETAEIYNIIYW